jgi:hypothetical protein
MFQIRQATLLRQNFAPILSHRFRPMRLYPCRTDVRSPISSTGASPRPEDSRRGSRSANIYVETNRLPKERAATKGGLEEVGLRTRLQGHERSSAAKPFVSAAQMYCDNQQRQRRPAARTSTASRPRHSTSRSRAPSNAFGPVTAW